MSDIIEAATVGLPTILSDDLQEIGRRYIAARRRANESTLEAAEALYEARQKAEHGAWYVFLKATNTSVDLADKLLDIYTEAQRNPVFKESVAKGWLPTTQAALVARPSTPPEVKAAVVAQAAQAAQDTQAPPSKRQVEQAIQAAREGKGSSAGERSKSRTGTGFGTAPVAADQPIEVIPLAAPAPSSSAPTVLISVPTAAPTGLPPLLQLGTPSAPVGELPPLLFGTPPPPPPVAPAARSARARTDTFYAGLITALAVVAEHDQETIFREIVATADTVALVAFAIRDQAMEYSGLARYGYTAASTGGVEESEDSDDKEGHE